MSDFLRFSQRIMKRASQVENGRVEVVKSAAKASLRSLVYGTPVDTGKARSNWRVSIGAPTRSVIEPYSPGNKLGISERANAQAAIAAGLQVINSLKSRRSLGRSSAGTTGEAGNSLYITNSVPYLFKLRSGTHSKQQARDWVRDTSSVAEDQIKNFKFFSSSEAEEE